MEDLVRVNIYNKGPIKFLNMYGPIHNSSIPSSLFERLKTIPGIRMDRLDFRNPAQVIERIGYEKKNNKVEVKEEEKKESILSIENIIKEEENKEEFHDETDELIEEKIKILQNDEEENASENYSETLSNLEKKYSLEELEGKTRNDLRKILKDRKYFKGPMAPKYHDTLADLKEKILKTQ